VIEHAFEPFFTTKPTGMGTGLGLSMVYGFVKQSRGHIRIDSAVGQGTAITLYFPRSKERRERVARSAQVAEAPRLVDLSGETILVVEDDEEVMRFATDVLGDAGYRVLTARDGAGAMKLIERHAEIALLFTDVVLPGGMSGRQLATAALARRPGLKVLYATGYWRNAVLHHDRAEPDTEVLTNEAVHPRNADPQGAPAHRQRGGCAATGADRNRVTARYAPFASAIASASTSRSPMWLARISTSLVSSSAHCGPVSPRRASTSAT